MTVYGDPVGRSGPASAWKEPRWEREAPSPQPARKPCPFCGSPATFAPTWEDRWVFSCTNDACGAQVYFYAGDQWKYPAGEKGSLYRWERRAADAEQPDQ